MIAPSDSLGDLSRALKVDTLWEGQDDEFAAFARAACGALPSMTQITITRRTPSRRSAVAIGSAESAIVFIIAPEGHGTRITPFMLGPISANASIKARAAQSDGDANARAITSLIIRHVGPDAAVALMAPSARNHGPMSADEPDDR